MTSVIIFAAGHATRMKSDVPKVLHLVGGVSMIKRIVNTVEQIKPDRIVVVVSPSNIDAIKEELKEYDISYAIQNRQCGTGHAVLSSKSYWLDRNLILNGDSPFVPLELLKSMMSCTSDLAIVAHMVNKANQNGRIIKQGDHAVAIVEARDCTPEQYAIRLVNCGIYFVKKYLLEKLSDLKPNNSQNEYYLTDLVAINGRADIYQTSNEIVNVNTHDDLIHANMIVS